MNGPFGIHVVPLGGLKGVEYRRSPKSLRLVDVVVHHCTGKLLKSSVAALDGSQLRLQKYVVPHFVSVERYTDEYSTIQKDYRLNWKGAS